jgi:exodeoxyribonuclease VII large subunit
VHSFQSKIAQLQGALSNLDPAGVLARGYSITLDAQGKVITAAAQVKEGERLTTRLSQGSLESEVRGKKG